MDRHGCVGFIAAQASGRFAHETKSSTLPGLEPTREPILQNDVVTNRNVGRCAGAAAAAWDHPSLAAAFLDPRYDGIRVVGDVHGDAQAFSAALADARQRDLFVVQLGDLVDRGPDSAGALRLAIEMVAEGQGRFLLGNHDDKLQRALRAGSRVVVSQDLARTLAQIDSAGMRSEAVSALGSAPLWLRFGAWFMVHAGFDPAMLEVAYPDAAPASRPARGLVHRALRGQTPAQARGEAQARDAQGHPVRLHDWIDDIPAGLTVLVGHDQLSSDSIVASTGRSGGTALFCDTGCGKGGRLSWYDIPRSRLEQGRWRLDPGVAPPASPVAPVAC